MAAASIFFAYVGFDAVSTMAEEAKPRKINVAHSERSTAVGSGSGTSTDENRTIEGDVQA